MGGVMPCCGQPGLECPNDNRVVRKLACPQLLACMNEFVNRNKRAPENNGGGRHGLKHRFEEQENGKCRPGTDSWKNHDDEIRGLQDKLLKYALTYQKSCKEPPAEVLDYVTRPRPQSKDWKGNWNDPIPPECNKPTQSVPLPVPVPRTVPQSDLDRLAKGAAVAVGATAVAAAAVLLAPAELVVGATALIVIGLGSVFGGGEPTGRDKGA